MQEEHRCSETKSSTKRCWTSDNTWFNLKTLRPNFSIDSGCRWTNLSTTFETRGRGYRVSQRNLFRCWLEVHVPWPWIMHRKRSWNKVWVIERGQKEIAVMIIGRRRVDLDRSASTALSRSVNGSDRVNAPRGSGRYK